ncbi:Xaa-Pro aminopeptidase [Nakamurella sp. UYEF19]|uniref:M24 family metallopeptidase n=1 Tax=Nakamurella sp. UYEF19 TaxID=1756392 RepID=UPI003397F8A8
MTTTGTRFTQRLLPDFFDRVQRHVRESAAEEGLDAVFTDDPEDVAYLTGFFHHPCERPVAVWLPVDGPCVLLLPELERDHAESQQARAELAAYAEYPGVVPPFAALAARAGSGGSVGHSVSTSYQRLAKAREQLPQWHFRPTELLVTTRGIRHPEEIALHQEAARITDLMLVAGVEWVAEAITGGGTMPSEAELASHVTSTRVRTMYAEHDDVVVVSPLAGGLVYAGPNSAYPHGLPSGYRLQAGDTFMLSLGCAVGGRFVEGERTFILGEPGADQLRYYEAVRSAQEIGGQAIAPGVPCAEANRICLQVIRDAGLGEFIRHRQGHGIGLGMHEPPWLEDGDQTLLAEGMIVSNEPGIYVRGRAGYRISDSMLVTADGSRPLTSYPRDLTNAVIPF